MPIDEPWDPEAVSWEEQVRRTMTDAEHSALSARILESRSRDDLHRLEDQITMMWAATAEQRARNSAHLTRLYRECRQRRRDLIVMSDE